MNQQEGHPQLAAKTGAPPTLNVAIEQHFPPNERIIDDDLAPRLFSGMDNFWIKVSKWKWVRNWIVRMKERFFSGGWSGFIVRKCYIDDRLLEAVAHQDIKQAVNLGAGMDTRFYRFKDLASINMWELDQPSTVNYKRYAMTKALGQFPENINLIDVDFSKQSAEDVLMANSFNLNKKTFYIMEAVSQYLDTDAIDATFSLFSKASPGSYLAFTYVPKDFTTGENKYGEDLMYKLTVKRGLWPTGFFPSEIPEFLQQYGWTLVEDLDYGILNERYVKPTGGSLGTMRIERVVFAIKA